MSLLLIALTLSACEISIGGGSVSADEIESKAAEALQKEVGAKNPPEVDCPEDLDLEEGKSETCTLTDPANGDEYDMTATIKSVDGDTANFDFQVAAKPKK